MNIKSIFKRIIENPKSINLLLLRLISIMICLGILIYTLSLYNRDLNKIESIVLIIPIIVFSMMILLALLTPLLFSRKSKEV
jgi:uncharacterized membrane protein YgdD (TMEM256/DUF423 family)